MSYRFFSNIPLKIMDERNFIQTEIFKGEFWKPCPGTGKGYICCGYQILTPLSGCGMYCSYCILQVYYDHQYQVLYRNFEDLENEVKEKLSKRKGVVRFGTGEFGDSLFLEERFGLSKKIAELLEPYPNVLVEFKTKSAAVESLKEISNPSKVVIGFSVNTPRMIAILEKNTALLKERLEAARYCERMGFWVSFHFDPMLWYDQWEEEYREVVESIFSYIDDPRHIAWWSLGGFRTIPALKKRLKEYNLHLPLFSGEIVLGMDKKYRYFRPIRVDFYKAMQEQVEKYYPETTLYLCMESPEIWEKCGMAKRIPNGLVRYLDERAEVMLNLKKEGISRWVTH